MNAIIGNKQSQLKTRVRHLNSKETIEALRRCIKEDSLGGRVLKAGVYCRMWFLEGVKWQNESDKLK